jgi:hypothetical protein
VKLLTKKCPQCDGAGQYMEEDAGPFWCNCDANREVLTPLGRAVDWLRWQQEQGLRRFWIHHPGPQNPVGPCRWLAFKLSERLYSWHRRLEHYALGYEDDGIPF